MTDMHDQPAAQAIALTEAETSTLRTVAGLMIPANATYRVPGADDDLIFRDILASLGRDKAPVRAALRDIQGRAGKTPFADLPPEAQTELLGSWRTDCSADAMLLVRAVLQCYYRDDRVMLSLGMEPRSPFPKGHQIEEVADWTLLDPVKARGPIWRPASGANDVHSNRST